MDTRILSDNHPDNMDDTVRLQRPPPRVFTDVLGCNVWMGDVDPLELELEQPINTDPYNSAAAGTPTQRI